MSSDNPSGADNQQETQDQEHTLDPWWIVGTVRRSERKATHALSQMYQDEKGARAPRESGGFWQRIRGIRTLSEITRSKREKETHDSDGFEYGV